MKKNVKDSFVPVYWKGSVEDVERAALSAKRAKVTALLPSAGKRNIYLFEYGESSIPKPKVSLSSAYGSRDYRNFADKTKDDYVPTVFLAACMHGGEWEGTVACLNLIKLLETGTDYAGNRNDTLVEACSKVHLLIMPMCNPDGRARIPFNNFVGKTFEDLRYYNQGTWLDGTLCGWPDCMKLSPIKEYCEYLGGYFNDDGVNMYNDEFFISPSNETLNVLKTARDNVPDMTVLLHGGDNTVNGFMSSRYMTRHAFDAVNNFADEVAVACTAEGYKFDIVGLGSKCEFGGAESATPPHSFTFPSAVYHTCGEPCAIYESNQGLVDRGNYVMDNDGIYRSHMILFETTVKWVLKNGSTATKSNRK